MKPRWSDTGVNVCWFGSGQLEDAYIPAEVDVVIENPSCRLSKGVYVERDIPLALACVLLISLKDRKLTCLFGLRRENHWT